MFPRALMVATALVPLLFVGCTGTPPQPPDDGPGTGPDRLLPPPPTREAVWWHWTGIQCETTPWEAWAEDLAVESGQAPAQGPYQRSAPHEEEMRRYFDDHAFEYDHAWAYFDDESRPAVCGAPDGWQYWTYTNDIFPTEQAGWQETPEGPPAAVDDQGP